MWRTWRLKHLKEESNFEQRCLFFQFCTESESLFENLTGVKVEIWVGVTTFAWEDLELGPTQRCNNIMIYQNYEKNPQATGVNVEFGDKVPFSFLLIVGVYGLKILFKSKL